MRLSTDSARCLSDYQSEVATPRLASRFEHLARRGNLRERQVAFGGGVVIRMILGAPPSADRPRR